MPYQATVDTTTMRCDFTTLREFNNYAVTSSRLTVEYTNTKNGQYKKLFDQDLVRDLLLPASIMNDLDIEHDFIIELEFDFTSMAVAVTIGEWKHEFREYILY